MATTRVIYLRTEDESLMAALADAASDDHRSVNSYALSVLENHLRVAGYLD